MACGINGELVGLKLTYPTEFNVYLLVDRLGHGMLIYVGI